MPPLAAAGAAIGGAISSAVGGLTLAGVATGATIVGTGLQLVGMATGSKTLTKIGSGMSLAGGVGQMGNLFAKTPNTTMSSLLKGSSTDDVLSSTAKGAMTSSDIVSKSPDWMNNASKLTSADKFKTSVNNMDFNPSSVATSYTPETRAILERIDNTLTRYNMPMNILGGMGEAYMTQQVMDQRERMQDKELQLARDAVTRRSGMPGQFPVAPAVTFNPDAYSGLLRS